MDSFLEWVTHNQPLVQALSTLSIAALTALLLAATWIYAKAARDTLRLMESHFRAQLRPFVSLSPGFEKLRGYHEEGEDSIWSGKFSFTVSNAPLCFCEARFFVACTHEDPALEEIGIDLHNGEVLAPGTHTLADWVLTPCPGEKGRTVKCFANYGGFIVYSDVAGLSFYETNIGAYFMAYERGIWSWWRNRFHIWLAKEHIRSQLSGRAGKAHMRRTGLYKRGER